MEEAFKTSSVIAGLPRNLLLRAFPEQIPGQTRDDKQILSHSIVIYIIS